MESCETYRFFLSSYQYCDYDHDDKKEHKLEKEIGYCRRHPPAFSGTDIDRDSFGFHSLDGDASDFFTQPVTKSHWWCGEFVSRKWPK